MALTPRPKTAPVKNPLPKKQTSCTVLGPRPKTTVAQNARKSPPKPAPAKRSPTRARKKFVCPAAPSATCPQHRRIDRRHEQPYHGLSATSVTEHLRIIPPPHPLDPAVKDQPPPAFNRKASSVTAHADLGCKPPPYRPDTAPSPYFGRTASSVTDYLRYVPPAHLGKEAEGVQLPYHGHQSTYITDHTKHNGEDPIADDPDIIAHWSKETPKMRRLAVPPQQVSRDVLTKALSARQTRTRSARRPTETADLLEQRYLNGILSQQQQQRVSPSPPPLRRVAIFRDKTASNCSRPGTAPSPKLDLKAVENAENVAPAAMTTRNPATTPRVLSSRGALASARSTLSKAPASARAAVGTADLAMLKQQSPAVMEKVSSFGQSRAASEMLSLYDDDMDTESTANKIDFVNNWVDHPPTTFVIGSRPNSPAAPPPSVSAWGGTYKDDQRSRPWPKQPQIDRTINHSRRATSITKFAIF